MTSCLTASYEENRKSFLPRRQRHRSANGGKSSFGLLHVSCICLCLGILAGNAAIAGPFFTDDFEDGNLRDGVPVAWIDGTGGSRPASVDNSGGNLSLTKRGNDQGPPGSVKVASTLSDAILRTQFRFTRSDDPNGDHVVLFGRESDGDCGLRYCGSYWAAINPGGRLAAGIFNSKTGQTMVDGWMETGRRSFDRDVVLELELEGNTVSTTAWYADRPKPRRPQYTFTNSRFTSGNVGLGEKVYVGTAAAEFRYFQVIPVLAGDFSGDGVLDASDVDILGQQIAAATNDESHDLTGDGLVNQDDRNFWVKDVKHTWYGDANLDGEFNSGDLVHVLQAGTFAADLPAGWNQGDWNGDERFDRSDIIVALQDGGYGQEPLSAIQPSGIAGDSQTSIIYDAGIGQLSVDAPAGVELTSINIESAAGIFTGESARNLGGSFDNDADANIFKATFGGSFGSLSFGNVAQPGLSEQFVAGDLSVVGSLAGGDGLGNVDLVYVPEPSTMALFTFGLLVCSRRFGARPRNLFAITSP